MARFYPSGGAGGGSGSDECTATKAELMKGYTAILSDSGDEPAEGTLELTGNAQAGHVLAGETFYTTNPKQKQTGSMTVNSLLSFSVAVSSGRRVTATWKNPKAASGKPYSGVVIRYSTSGYPGKTGGTQIYKGAGNNTVSEGMSSASFDMSALNTTYYFSIYPYVTCSSGEMTGNQLNASVKTGGKITKTFTASGSLTIQGYSKMDVFLVGGGGGGGYSGGGGGRTTTKLGIPIASGDTIAITVGAGGGAYSNGGASSVSKNGALQASAAGGSGAANSYGASGGAGGSGGGAFKALWNLGDPLGPAGGGAGMNSRQKIEVPSYKGRRHFSWIHGLLLLVAAGIVCFAALFGAVLYGSGDHITGEPQVMVVLGCQVKQDGPSQLLRDRLDEAAAYLTDHPDMTVVVSGGQGPDEPTTEARAMADYLMEEGVEEERILLEDQSHNTSQNLRNSAQVLKEAGYDLEETDVLVVSNGFHLTRARMLAERAGFGEIYTLAAPTSHLPSRLKMYIREPLALVKSFVFDR